MDLEFRLLEGEGEIKLIAGEGHLKSQGNLEQKMMVVMSRDQIDSRKVPITIGVYGDGELRKMLKTTFLGPSF